MDPPGFLEGPGEVEEPGAQSRLEEDENGPEGAEPRFGAHTQRRFGGGCRQQADALSGQLLHAEAGGTGGTAAGLRAEQTGLQGGVEREGGPGGGCGGRAKLLNRNTGTEFSCPGLKC